MATERFTKQEFEDALPPFEYIGIINGEHCYSVPLGNAALFIRSSIDASGEAADTGDDSIRIFLVDNEGSFLITERAKIMNYVTRVSGWQVRMHDRIENMIGLLSQLKPCKHCGEIMRIQKVQKPGANLGKLFATCSDRTHDNPWTWVKPDKKMSYGEYMDGKKVEESSPKQVPGPAVQTDRKKIQPPDFSRSNEYQLNIVKNMGHGPCLITAGAGSGKTKTMVDTVINMLYNGIDPEKILLITFTTKAAAEMRTRIAKAFWPEIDDRQLEFFKTGQMSDDPLDTEQFNRDWVEADPIRSMLIDRVCTIHAMCLRLLKATGQKVNVLSDRSPHWYKVKQIVKDSLEEFKWKESPKKIEWWIDNAINNLIDTKSSLKFFNEKLSPYRDIPEMSAEWLSEIYFRYMQYCNQHRLVSFSMMQANVLKGIRTDRGFLDTLIEKFDYILVDEAQDTNWLQSEIIFAIIKRARNVSFVGDVRQCIYRWNGAVPEIMEEHFSKVWEGAKRFDLPINYRSTQLIVESGNKLIRKNYIGKEELIVDSIARPDAPRGEPIEYEAFDNMKELCEYTIRKILDEGHFEDWAVLSRTRAEGAFIHAEMIRAGVPSINLNGGLLIGASHIKKVLAYMRLAINYQEARDNLEILREIANVASDTFLSPVNRRRHTDLCNNEKPWIDCGCPVIAREGIDFSPVRYYGTESINRAGSWYGIMQQRFDVNKGGYPTQASKGANDLVDFVQYIEQFKDDALACMNAIISKSVMPWLMHEEGLSDSDDLGENSKAEDFDVLRDMVKPNMTVEQFLEDMDGLSAKAEKTDTGCVEIGTIHKYKGSERKYVIVNMTRLPIQPPRRKKGELPVGIPTTIEDERNIAYVAITRAKEKLIVVESGTWMGQPQEWSPFVPEIGFVFDDDDDDEEVNEVEDSEYEQEF